MCLPSVDRFFQRVAKASWKGRGARQSKAEKTEARSYGPTQHVYSAVSRALQETDRPWTKAVDTFNIKQLRWHVDTDKRTLRCSTSSSFAGMLIRTKGR